jgi:4-amino-4-deoxy-L-arabinose transferase-like glycosyltransferase
LVQVASAKLFGFVPLSVLMPQAIEGMVSIAVVRHLVRRRFGSAPGLLAAFVLAITPISVAVDRSSNTDSCLVMILLLAAWALLVAAERGSWRLLLLAMGLLGIGFNVKMMAASVVVPAFALTYWLGSGVTGRLPAVVGYDGALTGYGDGPDVANRNHQRGSPHGRRPIHLAAGGIVHGLGRYGGVNAGL